MPPFAKQVTAESHYKSTAATTWDLQPLFEPKKIKDEDVDLSEIVLPTNRLP